MTPTLNHLIMKTSGFLRLYKISVNISEMLGTVPTLTLNSVHAAYLYRNVKLWLICRTTWVYVSKC